LGSGLIGVMKGFSGKVYRYKLKKAAWAGQPFLEKEKKMKKLTLVSDNY